MEDIIINDEYILKDQQKKMIKDDSGKKHVIDKSRPARVVEKTANSVRLFEKARTEMGVDAYQWYTEKEFRETYIKK